MRNLLTVVLLLGASPVWSQVPDSAATAQRIRARLALGEQQTATADYAGANTIWAPDLIGWYLGQPDDTYEKELEGARQRAGKPPSAVWHVEVNEGIVSRGLAVVRDTWTARRTKPDGKTTQQTVRRYEIWRPQACRGMANNPLDQCS